MASKEGYDVLRLIEHNQLCYVSSDYVRGLPLIKWLKYHPNIAKEKLFSWIQSIIKQLGQFHRCRGNPCYQYVNPYSIIVMEEGQICLLDLKSVSNEGIKRKMQRRNVREYFLPVQEPYYQRASIGLDIYGFGRTLQYMLAMSEVEPPLSRQEVKRLKNIIARCSNYNSKKSYQTVQEIQNYIPRLKEKRISMPLKFKIGLCILAGAMVVFFGMRFCLTWSCQSQKEKTQTQIQTSADPNSEPKEHSGNQDIEHKDIEQAKLKFETGLVYFVEAGDYKKSLSYFQEGEKHYELSKQFAVIARILAGDQENPSVLKEALKQAESLIPDKNDIRYYQGLMSGYALLSDKESNESMIRLGEDCLDKIDDLDIQDGKRYVELYECTAAAHEKAQENDQAVKLYEVQLGLEEDPGKKADIYAKLVELHLLLDERDRAWDTCERGIEELPDSEELKILYIRMQCSDSSVDRVMCADTIRRYKEEQPEILDSEEFRKLANEYEIHVEGDQIWVGSENGPS